MSKSIEVKIVGDSSNLQSSFRSAGNAANNFGSSLGGKLASGLKLLGVAAAGAAVAIGAGLVATLKVGFRELGESQAQLSKAEVLIKNLGSATKITTGDISNWADEIQNATGLQDDLVMSAENVLLRFESIASDKGTFRRATAVAADMSVALGKDLPAAAQMLGRALAEPEAAAGKLARMGVVLTEEQQKVIESFMATGDQAGALEYLLGQLEGKFGGVAEAAGETLQGKIEKLKRRFEDWAEALATRVLPLAERLVDWLSRIADVVDKEGWGAAIGQIFDDLGEKLQQFGEMLGRIDWGKVGSFIGEKLGAAIRAINWGKVATSIVGLLGEALAGIGDAFKGIGEGWGKQLGDKMGKGLGDALGFVMDKVAGFTSAMGDAFEVLGKVPGMEWAKGLADDLHEAAGGMNDLADHYREVGRGAKDAQKPLLAVQDIINSIPGAANKAARLGEIFANSADGINKAELATVTLTAALDRVPTQKEVKTLLHNEEFNSKLQNTINRINGLPATKETKARLIAEAAIQLAEELKGKIEKVPNESKTNFSTPGAADAKDKADDVNTAVRRVPDKAKTNISTSGAAAATREAMNVAAAVNNIPDSKTVYVYFSSTGVPHFQHGGAVERTQMALVGERGPELVALPGGSYVYDAQSTRKVMRGMSGLHEIGPAIAGLNAGGTPLNVTVHVQGSVTSERDLIRTIYDGLISGPGQLNPSLWGARS